MYLSELIIRNFRLFGEGKEELQIKFLPGVTAIVGRNDSGKSAVIDAIRYALLTRDQQFIRVQSEDFHIDKNGTPSSEIYILCKFVNLSYNERGTFLEHLSYEEDEVVLYVNWTAHQVREELETRRWVNLSVRSGIDGSGPVFEVSVRELLSATYLRPLRDAEHELSPGRGSRLSQILANVPDISQGNLFDEKNLPKDAKDVERLGLVGLTDYLRHNVKTHPGVGSAEESINEHYLKLLTLKGDELLGKIDVSQGGNERSRLRQILERLELGLLDRRTGYPLGRYGLGSNNLLFIACELLLLGREPEGLPLLLIEEPEAHLHPQRQLRLMTFLSKIADAEAEGAHRPVQVVLTTHSPNLSSKIPLGNLVLLDGNQAFSLAKSQTSLTAGDYRFLERFLDVTKANLFFAHGVLIVEGHSEAILVPTLAKLIDKDLTEHGVSIVNVGGKGLNRFSRVFQRSDQEAITIGTRVACVADFDVMPDCAPEVLGLVDSDDDQKWQSNTRKWRVTRDFEEDSEKLKQRRKKLKEHDGQSVRTFVSTLWTFEYDLAFCGLAEQVYIAAYLAKNDDSLNKGKKRREKVESDASEEFAILKSETDNDKEMLCSKIYKLFYSRQASKTIAAQYLSEILEDMSSKDNEDKVNSVDFRKKLPDYLVDAIDYVTGGVSKF